MNPEPQAAKSFWKKNFCQPSDPLAGQWKHELLGRAGWMLISCLLFSITLYILIRFQVSDRFVAPPILGFLCGLPELLLRRSWKIGAVTMALGTIVIAIGINVEMREGDRWSQMRILLGIVVGLCAGLGARSLFSAILGLFGGAVSGLLSVGLWKVIEGLNVESFIYECIFAFSWLFPYVIFPGLSVCLGLRWSKRRASGTSTPS